MDAAITVRGTRDGLLIYLGDGDLDQLMVELTQLVENRNTFFRGGKVALHVGERLLRQQDVIRLRQALGDQGVDVWAVLATSPETCEVIEGLGLETVLPSQLPSPPAEEVSEPEFIAGTGLLVERTLRSGQTVAHAGHVVILGDVNAGAEVLAGGDIVVWGHLRGTVHAGAGGDDARCVCALDLSPLQLRIGGHIARPPDNKRRRRGNQPERAFVSDGRIIAEAWK
jgi:septum site-determining protein MinC